MSLTMEHNPERQHELLQQIGEGVLEAVGDDWEKVYLRWSGTISISTVDFQVTRRDGQTQRIDLPTHVDDLITELRTEMYREDLGTWFLFTFTLTPPGSFSVDYDYDSKPEFPFELDPVTYNNDLNRFPRARANHPDWLWEALLEADQIIRARRDAENTD
ncbi:antitoxin YezG family protein [Nocardiopsis exhalans]|uniref:Antitoxin YezG family protein n=1 Tax=Nocardiopsis exhalans TaxID=163604 RepID=A0ABY5D8K7_9ACTN|nr:immunity protein YezG family protein [Nocardiopsis exhalans]USY19393.1 antitoxin YezG family protein [Nocardiopsis exhalans]